MFKYTLSFIAFLSFQIIVFGQGPNYLQLIDSSTKHSGIFIGIQPIDDFHLNITDTTSYKHHLEEESTFKIDMKVLVELINNSKNVDTSSWTDGELKKAVLVKSRGERLNVKDAISKLKLLERVEIRIYRRQIEKFNRTNPWDRNIFYFSRPIFDNSKQFALVYYSNGHSGLNGGGSITVFQYIDKNWKQIGNIKRWSY